MRLIVCDWGISKKKRTDPLNCDPLIIGHLPNDAACLCN